MKTPPFLLIGCPVIILIAGIVYALTYPSLRQTSFHAALMDAERPASAADDSSASANSGSPMTREQRMQQAFAQLGLSDAQQDQIKQIRQTITDRTQRREAIMNVLTPEQRAKWQQMRDAQHHEITPAASPTTTSGI